MSENIHKGDIVLVRFPFTNLQTEKLRPALVLVGEDELGDVCLAFITSRPSRKAQEEVALPQGNATGLKTASLVRLKKIATLNRDNIAGKIGTLPAENQKELDEKLATLFQIKNA